MKPRRTHILAARLREVLLDGQWIANTNYKAELKGLTWVQAKQKVNSLNSIAALIYHIKYYLEGLNHALESGRLDISDKYSFDLPEINSENEWQQMVEDFLRNAEEFVLKVEAMQDELLDKVFIEEKYGTYLRNIEGVIEHSYYHLGQVVLLKKITLQNPH